MVAVATSSNKAAAIYSALLAGGKPAEGTGGQGGVINATSNFLVPRHQLSMRATTTTTRAAPARQGNGQRIQRPGAPKPPSKPAEGAGGHGGVIHAASGKPAEGTGGQGGAVNAISNFLVPRQQLSMRATTTTTRAAPARQGNGRRIQRPATSNLQRLSTPAEGSGGRGGVVHAASS